MTALPKPAHRVRAPRPIRRGASPRIRKGSKAGDYRARIKYANDLWRRLIYAKEPCGACPRCFARQWHDAAHCWTKGAYPALRFEIDNGAPLCRACHRRIDSDHQAKEDFFRRYIGPVRYEALRLRALARSKADLALTIMFLEQATRRGTDGR
jgi:hypothetical protein